jgi:tetratricopeptide (TPR) repeat protein
METLFAVRDVARIFGLKESRLRYWAQTGFINPRGRRRGRRMYTFGDLIEIRAARDLLEAGIPLQRVRRNLQALRQALPEESHPIGRLRVQSDGDNLAVSEDQATFNPISGQLLLDFEIDEVGQSVAEVLELASVRANRPTPAVRGTITSDQPAERPDCTEDTNSAYGWFLRGCACDEDPERADEAIAAYQRAIELDPSLAAAHTNLGNLYYQLEQRAAAARCYEAACALDPDLAEARYNLANIYEEEDDLDLAIAEYRRALHCAPDFSDAHFNLALTLERVGSRVQAITHWRRYLELAIEDRDQPWRTIAREHLAKLETS